eukprot:CAMPEP_0182511172 /NCGR_PEP_ID=MMETSP1321-20130603/30066_1 /TAXON_ID=91990 /ORGANISM="Bolidomonas sp., Strain RCC1657" /LENGTH=53 /DNA_ID=CAMNT_0024717773 /DNA_START=252 /DNA_END=413 /DNA_ORIENTATION=+
MRVLGGGGGSRFLGLEVQRFTFSRKAGGSGVVYYGLAYAYTRLADQAGEEVGV